MDEGEKPTVQEYFDSEQAAPPAEKRYQKTGIKPEANSIKRISRTNEMDAELERILQQHRATIKVVGCGGSGNNTINRITEVGVAGAETVAVNTDAQDLLYTSADKKVLIGKEITRGLGAGSDPKIGED